MPDSPDRPWFTKFLVESDARSASDIVWTDSAGIPTILRKPTRVETWSILTIGILAFAFIALMVVSLIVAVYITRH